MNQQKKWGLAIGAVVLLVVALFFIKFIQFRVAMAGMAFEMPPETVTTVVAQEQKWPSTLTSVGTLKPVNGILLSADLPGNVVNIFFESGAQIKKGDLLVQQDITEEQAQLNAAEARKSLAELNLRRFKGLLAKQVSSQSDYDQSTAEYLEAEARCKEIKAIIEKKSIRAPFDGLAGIRLMNVGQYLQPGDKIVQLQSLSPMYVNFSLPQQELAMVSVGHLVKVTSSGENEHVTEGKITAVDSVVDEATRNFLVQATLENTAHLLRPGMFMRVEVILPGEKSLLAIPATSINYAPYGNSVFVLREMKNEKSGKIYTGVEQRFVKLGEARGEQVEILSGIQAGDEVVTSGTFKLRPNIAVVVNNEIQPGNSLTPQPKDR